MDGALAKMKYQSGYKKLFYIFFIVQIFILSSCSFDQAEKIESLAATGPSLNSFTLVSYTSNSATVNARATFFKSGVTDLNEVKLHLNSACTDSAIGRGILKDFSTTGIDFQLTVPATGTSKNLIYVSTTTLKSCFLLGEYVFNPDLPSPPVFNASVPTSPSRITSSPLIYGLALVNSDVTFYSDVSCATQVGHGTSADFLNLGILITLPTNATTTIYGKTIDSRGHQSACGEVTQYQHSVLGPAVPVFSRTLPVSPTNVASQPLVFGTVSVGTDAVTIYSDAACSVVLANDTATHFVNDGITITVLPNTSTTLYAKSFDVSGNPSTCTFLTNYIYDTNSPMAPIFTSASPASPTNQTIYPKFKGTASADTSLVRFYKDDLCLVNVGSGTKYQFESTGILVTVDENAISTVYAMSVDAAGNLSTCTSMLSYKHNIIPPEVPVFSNSSPVSPNNISATPYLFGKASDTTVSLDFYSDMDCTGPVIGSGSSAQFDVDGGSGIQVITPNVPNSVNTTDIYVQAIDPETNRSKCEPMLTYGFSTAKALSPSFTSFTPASPSRSNNTPVVFGNAPPSVTLVQLYSDNLCTDFLGSRSPIQFSIQGIQANLPVNKSSNIYAISLDKYGNSSDCVYFTNYVHDSVAPLPPGFVTTDPLSPTKVSFTPTVQGSVTVNKPGKILPVTTVRIFDNMLCLGASIGSGAPTLFGTTGLISQAAPNAITNLYAHTVDAAGNVSACTFLSNYAHSNTKPGDPQLTAALPLTPSFSFKTTFTGTLKSSLDIMPATTISYYSDNTCTTMLTTDSVNIFKTTGSAVVLGENTTTNVYAQVSDLVGNLSNCAFMVSYVHNNIGPSNLQANQNLDGSVILSWLPDATAIPTAKYVIKRSKKSGGPYTIQAWQNSGSSYTDFSVRNNERYYYVVAATNNTGTSHDSAETSILVSASSTQTASALIAEPGSNVIRLSWQGFSENMFYNVLRATQSGGPYTEIKNNLTEATYLDESVTNGISYYYVVVAKNPMGESIHSNEVNATPYAASGPPIQLQIAYLTQNPNCSGSIGVELTWSAPSYFTEFQVKRSHKSGQENNFGQKTTATHFTDCNPPIISGDTTYSMYYVVEGKWGPQQLQVSTASSNEVGIGIQTEPTLTVNPGDNQIYVKWASVETATSYQIWRSTSPGWPSANYSLLDGQYNGTNYVDNSVVNGTSYFYVVISNFSNGRIGLNSAEASGKPGPNPGDPSNLIITQDTTSTDPVLTWSAPSHFNGFNVYRSTSVGGTYGFVGFAKKATYTDPLTISGTYYYKVAAVWGSFETGFTNIVAYTSGTPVTVSATSNATSITISWSNVTAATSYNILRSTVSGGPYTNIGSTLGLNFTNSTAAPVGNTVNATTGYFYVIQPVMPGSLVGQRSTEVSAQLSTVMIPYGLTVKSTTSSSVELTWAKVSGATQYSIYRSSTLGGVYSLIGTSSLNTYTANSLTMATTYYFKVEARVTGSLQGQSAAISALTVERPYAPTVLAGNNQVDVSWAGVSGALSYNLLRSTNGVTFTTLQAGVSGSQYTDSSAVNGSIYFYQIQAIFAVGSRTSLVSPAVTPGVTPLVPQGLSLMVNAIGTEVIVGWGEMSGITNYNVYLSTTSGGPWGAPILTPSSGSGNLLSGLNPDTKYYVVVTSVNGIIESAQSSELSFVTSVTPSAPSVVVNSPDIQVNWAAVSGAATYDLYRSIDGIYFTTLATGLVTTAYTDISPAIEYSYFYKYYPRDATGSLMAESSIGGPVVPGVLPNAPQNLTVESSNSTTVNLSWTQASQAVSYNVYRSTLTGGPYSLLTTVVSTVSQYQDTTVSASSTYYYIVRTVNIFGIESVDSNEVSVTLLDGPTSLMASTSANKVQLSWSAVGGASDYIIRKSLYATGPFGSIATVNSAVTSFQDSDVKSGVTYYYVIQALFGGMNRSVNSAVASVVAVRSMNLQVPIELTDQSLSSDVVDITFERTRTTLDTTAYDGAVTYDFEAVVVNNDSVASNLYVVDSADTVVATLLIPAGTSTPMRLRSSMTPTASDENYRIKLSGSAQSNQVEVQSARLLVTQAGATKTKIYVPLLSSSKVASNQDYWSATDSTNSESYGQLSSARIYQRDLTKIANLVPYSAWEFEVIVSSNNAAGIVALYNTNKQSVVANTEIQFDPGVNTVEMVNSPFEEGVLNFNNPINHLDQYQVVMKCFENCQSGNVSIYKAGLWVSLENLDMVEILFRNTLSINSLMSDSVVQNQRTLIDLGLFSNPSVHFQATASAIGSTATVQLTSAGTDDSGILNLTNILNSNLDFSSGQKQMLQTNTPLILNTNERFLTNVLVNGSTVNLQDTALVIQASP